MRFVRNMVFSFLIYLLCSLHQVHSVDVEAWPKTINDQMESVAKEVFWQCISDKQCTAVNSSCIDHTCQCPKGYIYNTRMTSCVKVATMHGDECTETLQCSRYLLSGGICQNNKCECDNGYYYIHGRCKKYSGLFEKCKSDDDCYVNSEHGASSCINGICKCSPGFYQREYRSCRRERKKIGEECALDIDCRFKNGYCDSNFQCAEKSDKNEDKKQSQFMHEYEIPAMIISKNGGVLVGSNCTANEDCKVLGNAICSSSGSCICNRAYFASETRDRCIPELGEPCKDTDSIQIPLSVCRNGVWGCKVNRVISKNNRECMKMTRKYKFSCVKDEWCSVFGPDASCQDDACTCNESSHYVPSELFCWANKGYGESCQKDLDCDDKVIKSELECANNICSCPKGTHLNWNKTACRQKAGLDEACEMNEDCADDNTICTEKVCACDANYYKLDGKCVKGINATCSSNGDCFPENSKCTSNICNCRESYVEVDIDSCLPVVPYGDYCEHDKQCLALSPNSICKNAFTSGITDANKTCECLDGYQHRFNKCHEKRVLGESCSSVAECYLQSNIYRAVCENGVCQCDWQYSKINDTLCKISGNVGIYVDNKADKIGSGLSLPLLLLAFKMANLI